MDIPMSMAAPSLCFSITSYDGRSLYAIFSYSSIWVCGLSLVCSSLDFPQRLLGIIGWTAHAWDIITVQLLWLDCFHKARCLPPLDIQVAPSLQRYLSATKHTLVFALPAFLLLGLSLEELSFAILGTNSETHTHTLATSTYSLTCFS